MKKLILTILFILIASTSYAGIFKVNKVYDGDTIRVEGHDVEFKVRLAGIDAPEKKQKFGLISKDILEVSVLNKNVNLIGYGYGAYNRVIAEVYVGKQNINLYMVINGFAEVYKGKNPKKLDIISYIECEKEAKRNKSNIWSDKDYISPKEFRRIKKYMKYNIKY